MVGARSRSLTVVAMGIWAERISLGTQLDVVVPLAALVVFLGFALWGCIARGKPRPTPLDRLWRPSSSSTGKRSPGPECR